MFTNGFCSNGIWGTLGTFGGWSLLGLILNLIFWFVLLTGISLLFVWALQHGRAAATKFPYDSGQKTANEILQAQYARGEITRDQYDSRKQGLG